MLLRTIAVAAAVAVSVALAPVPVQAQQNGGAKGKSSNAKTAKKKARHVAQGPKQRHQCKVGPYEKQTRFVMETVKNKPVYIAYWSSDGPFHCSFETWPGDGRAHWVDSKAGTVINLIGGTMLIERNGDKYFIYAREVDRMPYCGTFGLISGVLTVPVKKGVSCDWRETSVGEAGMLLGGEAPAEPAGPNGADPEAAPAAEAEAAGG